MILIVTYNGVDNTFVYDDAIPGGSITIDDSPSATIKINL